MITISNTNTKVLHCFSMITVLKPVTFEMFHICCNIVKVSLRSHDSPHILIGSFSYLFNGRTFLLVFLPCGTLARAVAVVGKFALGAAVRVRLPAETAVTHLQRETDRQHIQTCFSSILTENILCALFLYQCQAIFFLDLNSRLIPVSSTTMLRIYFVVYSLCATVSVCALNTDVKPYCIHEYLSTRTYEHPRRT